MAQGHSVDEYLETIYFLAFPIGEYRPAPEDITNNAHDHPQPNVCPAPLRRHRRLPMRPSGCGIAGGLDEAARVDYVAFLS